MCVPLYLFLYATSVPESKWLASNRLGTHYPTVWRTKKDFMT